MRKNTLIIIPLIFFSILYTLSIAPGLTWAYDGADGGDFLTAAITGGVPHPAGSPAYLLPLSLFTKLSFASPSLLGNILSLVSMVAALLVSYRLLLAQTENPLGTLISTLLFGTFPLVWSQALITEIYAFQTFLFVLSLYFIFKKAPFYQGLTFAVMTANHPTGIFLAPLFLLPSTLGEKDEKKNLSAILPEILQSLNRNWWLGLLTGLSVYIAIPLRAQNLAPVNWGRAINWDGFWWLVSGEMYQRRLTYFSSEYLLKSVRLWSGFLLNELGILLLFLALFSAIVLFKPTKLYLSTIWIALVYSLFAIVYYSPDSYIYLIPVLFSFALWIGQSLSYLLEKLNGQKNVKYITLLIIFFAIFINAIKLFPEMDISDDRRAEEYALEILRQAPADAIIAINSDEGLFSLWYFHFVEGLRPDLVIMSDGLFTGQPWYRDTLHDTYPDLKMPVSASFNEFLALNDERFFCWQDRSLSTEMDCEKPDSK